MTKGHAIIYSMHQRSVQRLLRCLPELAGASHSFKLAADMEMDLCAVLLGNKTLSAE